MGIEHWLQLSLTQGLGPILIRRLVDAMGGAEKACQAARSDLRGIEGIGQARSHSIHESLQQAASLAPAELSRAAAMGVALICREDDRYPPLLRDIQDPPSVLYVMGALEPRDLNALAVVGSRRCSHYGREQAERFAALLAGAGFTVVSGGARGIDSASHRGALQHPHGRTIAVMGSGLDVPYPPENEALFRQIAGRGAVVSELPFGTPPNAENFPRRNRIVSGMSRGVFVIEADERSGALITARLANEDHGRPVFALPGRVDNRMSLGPHLLIRDGAILVTKIDDIIEGLHPFPDSAREAGLFDDPERDQATRQQGDAGSIRPIAEVMLTDAQRRIVEAIGDAQANIDRIVENSGMDAAVILRELTFLSLKGVIRRVDGQSYARAGAR